MFMLAKLRVQFLRRNVKLCRKGDGDDITKYSSQHTQFNAERFKSNSQKRCDREDLDRRKHQKGHRIPDAHTDPYSDNLPRAIESTGSSTTPCPVYITYLRLQ